MADNKKIYLAIAGSTMESAGRTLQMLDADNKGVDDKVGFAFRKAGEGISAYAFGNLDNSRDALRQAGQALIEAAEQL